MPNTYPSPAPTLAQNVVSINRLLNDVPRQQRALRTLAQQNLIGDLLFPTYVDVTGSGSLVYEVGEGIYANDNASQVSPLAPYPYTTTGEGTAAITKLVKTGFRTKVADETVAHGRIDIVTRDLTKMVNSITTQYDSMCLSLAASAVTATQAATAAWGTNGAQPFADILLAKAKVKELNQGFAIDTIFLTPTKWAQAIIGMQQANQLPREGGNPVFTGEVQQFGGLTFVATTNLPGGTSGLAVDSRQFGGQIHENLGGDWTGASRDLQYQKLRLEKNDGWDLGIRFTKLPVVFETAAAIKLTGI